MEWVMWSVSVKVNEVVNGDMVNGSCKWIRGNGLITIQMKSVDIL